MSLSTGFGAAFDYSRPSWLGSLFARDPVLIKCETNNALVVGTPARFNITTRRAHSAILCIRDDDGGEVYNGSAPPIGFLPIVPLSTAPMRARLTLQSRRGRLANFEWMMVAKAEPPAIWKARAPGRARVGDTIPVSWKAAGAMVVDVEGGGLNERHAGHGEGAILVRPILPGMMTLRFTATDRFGSSVKTRIVRVVEIAPSIKLNRSLITGKPGETAVFTWQIVGAVETWLEARGERRPVNANGRVEVGIGLEPEELQLIARVRGETRTARLSVAPRFLTGLDQEF